MDIKSEVSHVSSQFYNRITNKGQLQPIKRLCMVTKQFLLNIKRSAKLTEAFDKIKIKHKFLYVNRILSLALLDYDLLSKNKKTY